MLKNLSIYRPRNNVFLEIIHEQNKLHNQLSTYNNRLLLPKLEDFDRVLLPIIKAFVTINYRLNYPLSNGLGKISNRFDNYKKYYNQFDNFLVN